MLVLRDHTHADFCVGNTVSTMPAVNSVLSGAFLITSLITLRNPIESYISLLDNNWIHFAPRTFDEYCRRILKMFDAYEGARVVMYEEFVKAPISNMKSICDYLQLPYSDLFMEIFDSFQVTGDSGRKGDVIETRPSRQVPHQLLKEIDESERYMVLKKKMDSQRSGP